VAGPLRNVLHAFGKDLVAWPRRRKDREALNDVLALNDVSVVLDIGANVGQYAAALRAYGYGGRIVSFEPVAAAHEELERAASADPYWTVAPRTAVGNETGRITMHVSNRTDMSSALPIREETLDALPKSYNVAAEEAPVTRLDAVFGDWVAANDTAFVKIDTQGFERHVIEGAAGVIDRIAGFQLEMSIAPLYEGEASWLELVDLLAGHGYEPVLILPGFFSKTLNRQLQLDAVFFRP